MNTDIAQHWLSILDIAEPKDREKPIKKEGVKSRVCSYCSEQKSIDEFHWNAHLNNYFYSCKECRKIQNNLAYLKRKETKNKNRETQHPPKVHFNGLPKK